MSAWLGEAAGVWVKSLGLTAHLAGLDFGLQWLLAGVAVLLKTEKFYDLAGSFTFLLLAYINYQASSNGHPRQLLLTGCVVVWALRLGLFLFMRVMKTGHDRRFKAALERPSLMFTFWTMQGAWVFFTLLPTLLAVQAPRQPPLGPRDHVGLGLWLTGFVVEVAADYQKTVFRNDAANVGKFISSGLWSVSRHPNYFGEILLWFGLYLSASSALSGWQHLAVLCPLMDYLLITRVSGIPALERYGAAKWGKLAQYREYVHNTPPLVPFWG